MGGGVVAFASEPDSTQARCQRLWLFCGAVIFHPQGTFFSEFNLPVEIQRPSVFWRSGAWPLLPQSPAAQVHSQCLRLLCEEAISQPQFFLISATGSCMRGTWLRTSK